MPTQTKFAQRGGYDPHEHARQPARPVSGNKRSSPTKTTKSTVGTRFSPGNGGVRTVESKVIRGALKREKKPVQKIREEEKVQNGQIENGDKNDSEQDIRVDDNANQEEVKQADVEVAETAEPVVEVRERTPSPKAPTPPPEPEKFTIEKFNDTMDNYAEKFASHKFSNITDDYPVDELISVVSDVTESIEEFKQQTVSSQRHLEDLKQRMRDVKERIQANVQAKANVIRVNDETQSIEERELTEKLARLNAQVAQANAELAEALRLSTETESTAVEAQLAAQRAKEEAKNIQEEIAFRAKVEERRKEQEKIRQEEERKKMEAERLRQEEIQREKEEEWRRKEHGSEKPAVWERWPLHEYMINTDSIDLGCIVRGNPNNFNQNSITCRALTQLECPVPFSDGEELISAILDLTSSDAELTDTCAICIPYKAPKTNAHAHVSREAVIKIERNGQWSHVETKEEVIDNYKNYKFAVMETKQPAFKVAVFSRLKRDYATISNKGGKVTSSYDQRISLSVPKNCIDKKDHILMEVQPVDSTSVNDLKVKSASCKGLLTSSPIVHMKWESTDFQKPVTVTVPCPPNPVKAKKIAAMRKAKEEQMKNPPPRQKVLLPHEIEALEKEKAKTKLQRLQEQLAEKENKVEEPKPTKWYMGEYAKTEDDENDNLFLVSSQGNNKWTPVENVNIMQVKLDLLQFDLDRPLEKFMVLRTRTNIDENSVGSMANEVSEFLSQKLVQVILKQKSEDPFDTIMSVVPSSKTSKTLKKLSEEGYDDGPEPSQVLSINEGDLIEVGFRGNVKTRDQDGIQFVYNSNLQSETEFYACEVDKYLQKNFPVFRGVVEVYRKFKVKNVNKRKRKDSVEEPNEPEIEMKREMLCELTINIPKYHVEQNSTVVKAPITIRNTSDPVNEEMIRYIAEELGDEWKTVASHLNVSKARVQAIIRNMQYGEQTDCDARYDMLMTWLKKTPKATDKINCLSMALLKSGRGDIAEDIRERDREYREQREQRAA